MCAVFMLVSLLAAAMCSRVTVNLDSSTLAAKVDKEFLSVTLDTSLMQQHTRWAKFDFRTKKVQTLLRGLSPGYLRVGGTSADAVFFNEPYEVYNHTGLRPLVVMTKSDWDNLVNLTTSTNMRLLFDFNLQLRYGQNWDPSDAIRLLQYSSDKGYGGNIDFELGNEPGLFGKLGRYHNVKLNGTQVGLDILTLKEVVSAFPAFTQARILGPDVVASSTIFQDFLHVAAKEIRAATVHHYYFAGPGASWKEYVDWRHFSNFTQLLQLAQMGIALSPNPQLPLWVGETSDSFNSGTPNISDRFVSGFLWLDKLGVAASMGVGVVMRQDFYGNYYGLLDYDLNPNPDYWLSYIHKKLVGQAVLSAKIDRSKYISNSFRVYAHCTSHLALYPFGAITVFFLNVDGSDTITMTFKYPFDHGKADLYLLTAPQQDMLSKTTLLNGKVLKLLPEGGLPDLVPRAKAVDLTNGVDIPPYSMGFLVLITADQEICYFN